MPSCPFCEIDETQVIWSNEFAIAFRDQYPVSPGHTLVIRRRHVASYFEASPWEKQALWQGVEAVQQQLDGLRGSCTRTGQHSHAHGPIVNARVLGIRDRAGSSQC